MKYRYYVITQEPMFGGEDCPPRVYDNISEPIECCRESFIKHSGFCMNEWGNAMAVQRWANITWEVYIAHCNIHENILLPHKVSLW